MATERTSKIIGSEMEVLKGKIRSLETKRAAHARAIEKARATRKAGAFKAHADNDSKAAEALAKSRESEIRAVIELEDVESAIAEGRSMFEKLEREWKAALDAEAWAAILTEAVATQKEAGLIDQAADALATLMGAHGKRLEHLKRHSHNLGVERAFATTGLRHAERIFAWRMIQQGFAADYEKPDKQYREATGYAAILAEQIEAAKAIYENHVKERQANEQAEAAAAEAPTGTEGAD